MREHIMKLLRNKLFILLLVLLAADFVLPATFLRYSNIGQAEHSLFLSEMYRDLAIWLFDNCLVSLSLLIILLALLDLITIRRITVVKRKIGAAVMVLLLIAPVLMLPNMSSAASNGSRETPIANKVIIITFDGTRADTFWNSNHWITQHKTEGVWARDFSCTYPTITYPNHVSIVTGTWSQIHRCEMNRGYKEYRHPLILRDYHEPVVDDIFEIADRYGIVTCIFVAPPLLASILGSENTYKFSGGSSETNMREAIEFIEEHKVAIEKYGLLALIHLPDSDDALHEYSTYSSEYRMAIERQGDLVGELIAKIEELGWENDTIVIVTADHGGISYAHFNRYPPLVCNVPFWAWGGPIRRGFEIKGGRLIDVGVTVAFALGIPKPQKAVGVVLYRIFREDVLREKRGIDNVEEHALREYRESLWRVYIDCVKYLLGITLLIVGLLFIIMDVRMRRRELRRLERGQDKEITSGQH